ncbi:MULTISPECIES: acyltransferase family protein [Dietzia]|uniref:acyltransferase family protein n=1 Tax=Dietzia TaxID=37914 RepID=UPI000D086A2D|nr:MULTISPECIES: acyltransferase [Dietzia]AVM65285.1 acyltransferase [Dietzia sp. oral taxon 368]MCT1711037.1 acyltransferase [Dietzia cinnamea]MCT2263138.1 acyltransferase [Dietzia cinnamea]MCT2273918.1 acyltransferase [Dietzia cinnamea]
MRSVAAALIVVAGGAVAARAAVRATARRRVGRPVFTMAGPGAASPGSVRPVDTVTPAAGPRAARAGRTPRTPGPAGAGRPPAGAEGFVPALEGIRGLAAVGVLTTHVAFVTRSSTGSPVKRLFGRLDLAVAVFFAKSGFLLWRAHADHARKDRPGTARPTREYLRSRLVRIMPAYAVLVAAAMLLLKQNHVNGPASWIANLTLTQIYTSNFLVAGLTHAWSLAVEMAFYLAFPLLWTALRGLRGDAARWRIPAIVAFGASGLVFPMIPWHAIGLLPTDVNVQILPPSFTAWFAAGMLLAEIVTAPEGTLVRACRDRLARWGWWIAGGAALVVTTVPAWFSEGFVHPGPLEFAARTGLAGTMAFLVLAPVVLAPEGTRFPVLESAPLQKVGTWSYGIFLWHQLVLHAAFPLTRTPLWAPRMAVIWPVTVAGSLAAGAASHRFLEEPARRIIERR